MRAAFWLLVAASVGFWVDEALHYVYDRTMHAPITHGRFHA